MQTEEGLTGEDRRSADEHRARRLNRGGTTDEVTGRSPGAAADAASASVALTRVDMPETAAYRFKARILGQPLFTEELAHERLGKPTALAVFASDNLSSSAYATEEILRVLVPIVGVAAFALVVPITVALLVVLGFLILSYRQTIKAYPSAGGAYIVTKDNFGKVPALVAGVSLLTDYILTVAVSVAAGSAALASAVPSLAGSVVPISVAFVAIIAYGNLRGVKESGKVFAAPTYFFLGNMVLLLVFAAARMAFGHLPVESLHRPGLSRFGLPGGGLFQGAALFVVLRAFASGGAAVTGVEAISNGVPAFREPSWRNARTTLVYMGSLLGAMFLGLSILAARMHVAPYAKGTPTVISQVGKLVYGQAGAGRVLFFALQAGTMLILVLAANTSFADFPRLASFAAADSFMPRQLNKRGHRLVFSNGIAALAAVAIVLVIATDAKVSRLIPLYAIGVFTSFTLSQAGMAKHHLVHREPKWRTGFFINATGAVLSLVVDVIIAVTKFAEGGWVIIVAVPILVLLLLRLNHQYVREAAELRKDVARAATAPIMRRHAVVILVDQLDLAAARAIQLGRSQTPDDLRAVHFAVDPVRAEQLRQEWSDLGLARVPLDIVDCPDRRLTRGVTELVAELASDGETEVSVLLSRVEHARAWHKLLHDQTSHAITRALVDLPHVNVTLVPYPLGRRTPARPKPRTGDGRQAPPSPAIPPDLPRPEGTVPIGAIRARERVTVVGRVRTVRVQPRAGIATLHVILADESGTLKIVFLGRRHIGGMEPGAFVAASGIVGSRGPLLEMLNPTYELLALPVRH